MKPKYLELSRSVRIKHIEPGQVKRPDDGITIPEPRVRPVDIETAKRRLTMFVANCAEQGFVTMYEKGVEYGTVH